MLFGKSEYLHDNVYELYLFAEKKSYGASSSVLLLNFVNRKSGILANFGARISL